MNQQSYTTIARRFRPKTFKEVLGQDALKETLKNSLINNTLASAYIFSGTRGTGKTSLARLFAKAINCQQRVENYEPCNNCTSCKEISHASSFEVIEIDGASNRGIDDIRNIHENLRLQTKNNISKIYIIDEVHMLTKEAFNALLKTLEEPASNTRFFFATTEIHKIPATILSRCQKFELLRISSNQICAKLKMIAKELNISVDDDALEIIAKLSEGSLRDAESLFDQMICFSPEKVTAQSIYEALGLIKLDLLKKIDLAYSKQDPTQAFTLAQEFFASGIDTTLCLNQLLEHYRNITLFKTSQQHLVISKTNEMIETYTKASQIYSKEALFYLLDYLTNMLEKLATTNLQQLHLEMLLLHILQTSKRVGIDTIIEKVETLSNQLGKKNNLQPPSSQTQSPPSSGQQPTAHTKRTPSISPQSAPQMQSPPINEQQSTPQVQVNPSIMNPPASPETNHAKKNIDSSVDTEGKENEHLDKAKLVSDETILQFASVEFSARLKKY